MRQIAPLVVLLVMLMGSATVDAAIYRVGSCSGSTHATLDSAWNAVGEGTGHVINLCQGNHTSPALIPTERHQNITLKPLSDNAADTTLIASSGTLFVMSYQSYTVKNLTVKSHFTSQGAAKFINSIVTGNITATQGAIEITGGTVKGNVGTNGNSQKITLTNVTVTGDIDTKDTITVSNTTVNGNLSATNGVTAKTNSNITGNITTTYGPINIIDGTINGNVGTNGGSQPINLTNVTMTGGSITTAGNTITIKNSNLGNANSRIPIVTNNYVVAEGSTVWGDIKAGNWTGVQTITLDPDTIVYGYCDPRYGGGGKCQPNSGGDPGDGGSGGECDVQLQLSVANHRAGSSARVVLTANILTGDSGCFDGDRTVDFYSGTVNPATPAPGEPRAIRLGSTPIANTSPGTALTVNFSDNTANLSLLYPDAGLMRLHACYEGTCSFADFVARPAGFTLAVPANPGTVAADGSVFTTAGADFQVLVTAIGANGERLPNFGRELSPATVQLQTSLLAPAGGESPGLTGGFGGFGLNCAGDSATWGTACGIINWSEVGAIGITPRIAGGSYLNVGPDIVGPNSVDVGRFIPHHFTLDEAAIEHRPALACSPTSDFTYLGEDLSANFKLQARALNGSLTRNYSGNFARLPAHALNPAALYNGENLSSELSQQAAQTNWLLGTGDIKLTLQMKRTTSGTNFTPAGPWTGLQLGLQPRDADGVQLANDHLTLDLNNDGNNDHGLLGEADLRFGRLLLDNALGSELGPLQLPATAQYWNGSTWVNNTADSCTRLSLTTQVQLNGNLSGTTTVPVGSGSSQITSGDLQLNEGRGFIDFSAPGSAGYIDVELLLDAGSPKYPFLQDNLDADGNYDQNPRGRASWGLYRGNNSTILMLEAQP